MKYDHRISAGMYARMSVNSMLTMSNMTPCTPRDTTSQLMHPLPAWKAEISPKIKEALHAGNQDMCDTALNMKRWTAVPACSGSGRSDATFCF